MNNFYGGTIPGLKFIGTMPYYSVGYPAVLCRHRKHARDIHNSGAQLNCDVTRSLRPHLLFGHFLSIPKTQREENLGMR